MRPGQRLHDRFEVLRVVARGGMGLVVEAEGPEGRVALKALHDAPRDDALRRFRREAQMLAALSHPNVMPLLESRAHLVPPLLVFPWVPGPTIAARLEELGAMPLEGAVHVVRQVLRGIAAAHAVGVVHRDLKPDNVLLGDDGVVRVLDFGIAAFRDGRDAFTPRGVAMGTPTYASPEQLAGADGRDPTVDVWGAGLLLHVLATAVHPFEHSDPLEVARRIREGDLPPMRAFLPNPPAVLEAVMRRALAPKAVDRWPSAVAMDEALGSAIGT